MTAPEPGDRTAAWIKAHPRLASLGAIFLAISILVSIGLRETSKAAIAGSSSIGSAYILKSVALVGGALFVVWRANRRMRRH